VGKVLAPVDNFKPFRLQPGTIIPVKNYRSILDPNSVFLFSLVYPTINPNSNSLHVKLVVINWILGTTKNSYTCSPHGYYSYYFLYS